MLLLTATLLMALPGVALGAGRQHDGSQFECLLVDLTNREEFEKEFRDKVPYLVHIMNEDGIKKNVAKKGGFVRFVLLNSEVYGKAAKACETAIEDGKAEAAPGRLCLKEAGDKAGYLANIMTKTHDEVAEDQVFLRFQDVVTGLHEFRDELTKDDSARDILFAYGMGCGKGPNKWNESELEQGRKAWEEKYGADARKYQETPMRVKLCQWRDDVNRALLNNHQPPIRSMTFVTGSGEMAVADIRQEDIEHFPRGQQAYIRALKHIISLKAQAG